MGFIRVLLWRVLWIGFGLGFIMIGCVEFARYLYKDSKYIIKVREPLEPRLEIKGKDTTYVYEN